MKGRQTQELGSVKNEIKKQIYIGVGLVASIALGAVVYIKSTSQSVENIPITQQVSSSYISSDVQADQNSTSSANHIQSIQASMYIGQNRIVCGKVAQLKEFSKGVYLNFDQPYPKATFTVVIWNNNSHISKQLRNVENNTLCIQGKIEEYRGKPQMVLNSLQQII